MNKKESLQKEIQKNWDKNPRWKGIKRPYTAAEVVNLKGSFPIDYSLASFFGGTSLLIIVGVALDTLQQIESHLLMRHYDGFMKSGKIKGRRRF